MLFLYSSEKKQLSKKILPTKKQAVITGLFQGCAAIPGISRSGSTIAGMGLLGIKKETALELSFLLSIPLVLGANIAFNLSLFKNMQFTDFIGLFSAFVFGLLTIELLLRIVRKVRFSYFVALFAILSRNR